MIRSCIGQADRFWIPTHGLEVMITFHREDDRDRIHQTHVIGSNYRTDAGNEIMPDLWGRPHPLEESLHEG
jgi:hypothetical protein